MLWFFFFRMAEKYNMRLVYVKPFREFFQEKSKDSQSLGLLYRMNALEVKKSNLECQNCNYFYEN